MVQVTSWNCSCFLGCCIEATTMKLKVFEVLFRIDWAELKQNATLQRH